MKNAEIIKGLDVAIKGLTMIKTAIEAENGGSENVEKAMNAPTKAKTVPATKTPAKTTAAKAPAKKSAPAQAESNADGQTYTVAELNAMNYNDFKKLAASLSVDCKGKRDEIMARVVATGVVTDAEDGGVDEPKKSPATTKSAPATKGSKSATTKGVGAKKPAEPAKDEFDEQAEEIASETDVEDILEALKDAGVKATKKNAVTKLAYALREGLVQLDDDEENEEDADEEEEEVDDTEEETADDEEEVEISSDEYFDDYDPEGYNDPEGEYMSEERAEAIEEKMDEILTEVSEGSLDENTITEFLQEVCTQEELDLLGDEYSEDDLLKFYMEIMKRFVDSEGEVHEQGEAYTIGDENFCCGHVLPYDEDTNQFICEHCASTYEAG